MVRILAFMNQKGGVGKTTTVVNLAAALARRGKRLLVLDCDPQANASTHFGVDIYAGAPSLYDVLRGEASIEDVLVTLNENLMLAPSELDLAGIDVELASVIGRETLLRDAIRRHLAAGHQYDYVFMDCPPSLGMLPLNALAAADEVAIILQAEFFALQGISGLQRFIDIVVDRINPTLVVSTVITCMYDSRTRFGREVIDEITGHFQGRVMSTLIRRNVKLAEASSHGVAIFDYDGGCPGAKDYSALAEEFLERYQEPEEPEGAVPSAVAPAAAETPIDRAAEEPGEAPPPATAKSEAEAGAGEKTAPVEPVGVEEAESQPDPAPVVSRHRPEHVSLVLTSEDELRTLGPHAGARAT